jgi:hypothetical protein
MARFSPTDEAFEPPRQVTNVAEPHRQAKNTGVWKFGVKSRCFTKSYDKTGLGSIEMRRHAALAQALGRSRPRIYK